MPRFVIHEEKPEPPPVAFSLEEDRGHIKLIASDGSHRQYVCSISPNGTLWLRPMDRDSAEAMGLQLDESRKIRIV